MGFYGWRQIVTPVVTETIQSETFQLNLLYNPDSQPNWRIKDRIPFRLYSCLAYCIRKHINMFIVVIYHVCWIKLHLLFRGRNQRGRVCVFVLVSYPHVLFLFVSLPRICTQFSNTQRSTCENEKVEMNFFFASGARWVVLSPRRSLLWWVGWGRKVRRLSLSVFQEIESFCRCACFC